MRERMRVSESSERAIKNNVTVYEEPFCAERGGERGALAPMQRAAQRECLRWTLRVHALEKSELTAGNGRTRGSRAARPQRTTRSLVNETANCR